MELYTAGYIKPLILIRVHKFFRLSILSLLSFTFDTRNVKHLRGEKREKEKIIPA